MTVEGNNNINSWIIKSKKSTWKKNLRWHWRCLLFMSNSVICIFSIVKPIHSSLMCICLSVSFSSGFMWRPWSTLHYDQYNLSVHTFSRPLWPVSNTNQDSPTQTSGVCRCEFDNVPKFNDCTQEPCVHFLQLYF